MLNYENRLVVVTYCIELEGLIQLDAESPTINKENFYRTGRAGLHSNRT